MGTRSKDQKGVVCLYQNGLTLGYSVQLPELYKAAGAKLAFDADTFQIVVDLLDEHITKHDAIL